MNKNELICFGYKSSLTLFVCKIWMQLNMVIKESLRLYPPDPIIERMACEDMIC